MASPARDFAITYGSVTVGTGSSPDIPIHGPVTISESHDEFEIEFEFIVFGTGPSDFNANLETVRTQFRTPNADLSVAVGDTSETATWYSFSKSSGTGFDAVALIQYPESNLNSFKSRLCRATVTVQLPADKQGSASGQYGRRESTVSIGMSSNDKRTLTISGVYTATDTTNSGKQTGIEQFDARIDAYVAAVQAAIDSNVTWGFIEQPFVEIEDTDVDNIGLGKVCRFERKYEELIFAEGIAAQQAGTLDDGLITRQRFRATRSRFNRSDFDELGQQATLDKATINYECAIDVGPSTNRSNTGAGLVTKYENTVREFIYDQARDLLDIEALTIIREDVDFNFDENLVSVVMEVGGIAGGTQAFAELDITDSFTDTGKNILRYFNGDPLSGRSYQGPATFERSVRVVEFIFDLSDGEALNRISHLFDLPNSIIKSRSVRVLPDQFSMNFDAEGPRFRRGKREINVTWQFFNSVSEPGEDPSVPMNDLRGVFPGRRGGPGIGI